MVSGYSISKLAAKVGRKFATHTRKNGETVKTLLADVRIVLIYCLWFNGIIILLNCKYFHSVVDNNRYGGIIKV